ncbi:hypothetical protein B296_00021523 [Ensete ventricosum]|uniref:Uncharacterized protein n=1 Tax=Ensete ventricosum TaxID=4639 RepID=A0A426Z979_ENSVE|nr:hypothetical protein B296_00021523 [Ensete ventricosum]
MTPVTNRLIVAPTPARSRFSSVATDCCPLTCEKPLSFCSCHRPVATDYPLSATSGDLVEQPPSSTTTPLG